MPYVEHFNFGDREHVGLRMLPCQARRTADEELEVFLHALHPTGFRDVRAIDLTKRAKPKTASFDADDFDAIKKFAKVHSGTLNVYVGVASRGTATGRDLAACEALHAVFGDFDFKDLSEVEIRKRLDGFPLKPSAVIRSGGGLQVYWFLTEPLPLKEEKDQWFAGLLLKSIATLLGGDPGSAEPAHILRLPETQNHKYSPSRPVVIESLREHLRYKIADFSIVPLLSEKVTQDTTPIKHDLSRGFRMRLAETWLARQPAGYEQGYRPDDPVQNGNTETYKVCCTVVHGHDLSDDEAFDVLRDWNARCDPPWPAAELRKMIQGAAKSAKGPRGAKLAFRRHTRTNAIVADSLDNVRLAIALLGFGVCYDAFAQKIFVNTKGILDDSTTDQIWVAIDDRFAFRPSKELLRTVLETEARHYTIHPVRAYLDGLYWDDTPRIDQWLVTYGGAEDTPLVRAIGRIVLVAAVRRVRQPGCKFDELMIWESLQGEEKSTALRTLCPKDAWFSDDLQLGASSKEVVETTGGKWIIEASELVGSKREAERLKGFLSRQVDGPVRLAYGHYSTEVPRQFIVVGTTNKHAYLKDATGNRRFWSVRVQRFDVAGLRRDRDQLWAEASTRERTGESIRLDAALWEAAEREQKRREIIDPWEEKLLPTIAKGQAYRIAPEDLWGFIGVAVERRDERAAERIATTMQRFGFKRMAVRDREGKVVWGWGRGEAQQAIEWNPLADDQDSTI